MEESEQPEDNSKEDVIDSEIDSETERSFETGEQEAGGEEDSGAGRHGNGRHGRGRHDGSGGGRHRGRQN